MRETLIQHAGLAWALLCGALFILLLIVLASRRPQRAAAPEVASTAAPARRAPGDLAKEGPEPRALAAFSAEGAEEIEEAPAEPAAPRLDAAEVMLALQDAEKSGAEEKLPALNLALARCRLAAGEAEEAAELLRRSIRGAGGERHKQTHAEARVVLGDIALAHGDATTACEHWQIARALFHELKQQRNHTSVEMRMLKNGCPTDWVLTDF